MSKLVEFLVVSLLWLLNHIHALLTWDLSAQPSPSLSLNIHSKPYTTQSECNGTLIRCVVAHHHSTIMERNKNVIDTKTTFKKKMNWFFFLEISPVQAFAITNRNCVLEKTGKNSFKQKPHAHLLLFHLMNTNWIHWRTLTHAHISLHSQHGSLYQCKRLFELEIEHFFFTLFWKKIPAMDIGMCF